MLPTRVDNGAKFARLQQTVPIHEPLKSIALDANPIKDNLVRLDLFREQAVQHLVGFHKDCIYPSWFENFHKLVAPNASLFEERITEE